MANYSESKADTVVLIFSIIAVLIAATLSMATISKDRDEIRLDSSDPYKRAELAAAAASQAAKWHIQCHGQFGEGGFLPRYYINGATYSAEWDKVNFADSTVLVRAHADFSWGDDKHYEVDVESTVKLDFFIESNAEIMENYYSGNSYLQ